MRLFCNARCRHTVGSLNTKDILLPVSALLNQLCPLELSLRFLPEDIALLQEGGGSKDSATNLPAHGLMDILGTLGPNKSFFLRGHLKREHRRLEKRLSG